MATQKIVVDDPDGETKAMLKEIGEVLDRPYSWVLRKLVSHGHASVFEYDEMGERTGVVRLDKLRELDLR